MVLCVRVVSIINPLTQMHHIFLLSTHTIISLSKTGHKVILALQNFVSLNLGYLIWASGSIGLLGLVAVFIDGAPSLEDLGQLREVLTDLATRAVVGVDGGHGSFGMVTAATASGAYVHVLVTCEAAAALDVAPVDRDNARLWAEGAVFVHSLGLR